MPRFQDFSQDISSFYLIHCRSFFVDLINFKAISFYYVAYKNKISVIELRCVTTEITYPVRRVCEQFLVNSTLLLFQNNIDAIY